MHLHDEKGDQIRDVIESKDGTVARLIMKDGRPLTDDEDKAERDRLNAMIDSPASFARHVKNEDSNRKIADDLMRLMPDAMIYTYVPDQPQAAKPQRPHYRDGLCPQPQVQAAHDHFGGAAGTKGRVWVDAKSRRVVRMEGTIFQPVNIGWGMLPTSIPVAS